MHFGQNMYLSCSKFIIGLSQDSMQQQANLVGLPTGCSLYSASRVSAQIALCTVPCLELVRKVTDQTIYHIIDIFYHNFSHNTRIIFLWYHYKRYGMFYFVLSLVLAFLLSIGQLDVAYGTVALVAILEAFS